MYKQYFINKKIIIFDLDGTLVDTIHYWDLALLDVLGHIGVVSELSRYGTGAYVGERLKMILEQEGNPSKISFQDLIKYANDSFLRQIEEAEDFTLREGFFELVAALRQLGKTLVLASNTDKYVVDRMLELLEIEKVFDYIITGDMVSKRKPDAEIYNAVAKHFGVTAQQCLVFEDSIPGIEAARRAKMDTIAIYDPMWDINPQLYPSTVLFYDLDFSALPNNLDKTPEEAMAAADALAKEYKELYKSIPQPAEDIE
jgi:beta-phosphoglucomutase